MSLVSRSALRRLVPALALTAALGGCASGSPYEALNHATPSGTPFARALFQDYSYLARSFGLADAPSTTSFDAEGSISVTGTDSDVIEIADTYARKAISASTGEEPLPEAAPTDNRQAEKLRMRLLRALDKGRTAAPQAAARTQSEYDCWILNGTVPSLANASAQCQRAFLADLKRLAPGSVAAATP